MKKTLFIIFLCIIPVIVFSGEANYKIGPLLHKKIAPSQAEQKTMLLHQYDSSEPTVEDESEDFIKIIVVMDRHHLSDLPQSIIDELETKVTELGGYIGDHAFNRVQVFMPVGKIKELAEWEEIRLIKLPTTPEATGGNVRSEGLTIGNINNWKSNGITGGGVKIGVLDLGFDGYSSLIGSELPINTTAIYTGSISDFNQMEHGTACAEIIHDVAPDADLYLVNAADMDVSYHNAVDWLSEQNVDIISSSMGLNLRTICYHIYNLLSSSYYSQAYATLQLNQLFETEELINFKVNQTVSGGTTWVQSAGNSAQARWKGMFYDLDGDGWHNFQGGDELNTISFHSYGQPFYITLAWAIENDFITMDDYDLYIYNDVTGDIVAQSTKTQSQNMVGLEACRITPYAWGQYSIAIKKYAGANQELTIMIGYQNIANLEYNSPERTINTGSPHANINVISVGAVPYYNPYLIENFSSQGPGVNGIIKPDLVAPDAVSTVSYGNAFYGTSAAAPHVAGVSALVKQRYPSYSPQQIKSYLESNALDLGATGKDNVYGSGLVQLPDIINCTYSISPTSGSFGSGSGTKTVSVTTSSSSCAWATSENLSWASLSPTSGTGSRSVTVSVTANTGAARNGSVTIAGETYTINQAAGILTKTTDILTNTSPNHTIQAGTQATVYGTSASNQITLESGAKAKLINFPGQNTIQIQSSSDKFSVSRSGTIVTFEGSDGTELKIPASKSIQTVEFNDGVSKNLVIVNGQVMLDEQEVTTAADVIDGGSDFSNLGATIDNFRFFEAGGTTPDQDQITFDTSFSQNTARYIYYQLNLSYGQLTQTETYTLTVRYYKPDGSIMGEFDHIINLEQGRTWSWHTYGWGWSTAGNWEKGTYTVKLFDGSLEITRGTFMIL
jgi:hypothetical protein